MRAFVYALIDPRSLKVRYIGSTINPNSRLIAHLADTTNTPKTQWLTELKSINLQPIMVILSVVPLAQRFDEEYQWIYIGKKKDWPLTNKVAMKTDRYTRLWSEIDEKIFVEIEPRISWAYIKSLFWSQDVPSHYITMRINLLFALLVSASVGILLLSIASIGIAFPHLVAIGGILTLLSLVISIPVGIPLSVQSFRKVCLLSKVKQ